MARNIKKKPDVKDYSFGHFTLLLSLHYLVKCSSPSLTIYKNGFIPGSACIGSENQWNHKITKHLLLI